MMPKQKPEISGLDSSNGSRTETAESRFIRLLTFLAEADGMVSTGEHDSSEDLRAYAELKAGGFISGSIMQTSVGEVVGVVCMEITIAGRQYLAQLNREAEAQTSIGIIKHNRWRFYLWFLGIVGATAITFGLTFLFGSH